MDVAEMLIKSRSRHARPNPAAAVSYADQTSAFAAAQSRDLSGISAVYAVTFGHHMWDMFRGNVIPIKVGYAVDVAARLAAADAAFLPSPLVVLRLYQPESVVNADRTAGRVEIYAMERAMHAGLGELSSPWVSSRRHGREWFYGKIADLDVHAAQPSRYRVEDHFTVIASSIERHENSVRTWKLKRHRERGLST